VATGRGTKTHLYTTTPPHPKNTAQPKKTNTVLFIYGRGSGTSSLTTQHTGRCRVRKRTGKHPTPRPPAPTKPPPTATDWVGGGVGLGFVWVWWYGGVGWWYVVLRGTDGWVRGAPAAKPCGT